MRCSDEDVVVHRKSPSSVVFIPRGLDPALHIHYCLRQKTTNPPSLTFPIWPTWGTEWCGFWKGPRHLDGFVLLREQKEGGRGGGGKAHFKKQKERLCLKDDREKDTETDAHSFPGEERNRPHTKRMKSILFFCFIFPFVYVIWAQISLMFAANKMEDNANQVNVKNGKKTLL